MNELLRKIDSGLSWLQQEIGESVAIAWPYVIAAVKRAANLVATLWQSFLAWLGPASESVRGRLNTDEVQRAVTKAAVSAGAFSLWKLLTDPEVISVFVVPAGIGILVAILDGTRRCRHGEAPTQ